MARRSGPTGDLTLRSVIKGDSGLKNTVVIIKDLKGRGPFILARTGSSSKWNSLGTWGPNLIAFLKVVSRWERPLPETDDQWRARLQSMRKYLGNHDSRIARSAWSEWARAPYHVLKTGSLDEEDLRTWLASGEASYARALWIVMLGIQGKQEDKTWIKKEVRARWTANSEEDLPALLTALVAQGGEDAVTWIGKHYLRDRDRTLLEIKAAVSALSLHGTESKTLRGEVLKVFIAMLDHRRPLSGLVAGSLSEWGEWGAARQYGEMLQSGEPVLPGTRKPIADYLAAHEEAKGTTATAGGK